MEAQEANAWDFQAVSVKFCCPCCQVRGHVFAKVTRCPCMCCNCVQSVGGGASNGVRRLKARELLSAVTVSLAF